MASCHILTIIVLIILAITVHFPERQQDIIMIKMQGLLVRREHRHVPSV